LIELLIVITVIGLLMGMLLVVISGIRDRAKALQTRQRIEDCLQTFTRLGEGERITAAFVLVIVSWVELCYSNATKWKSHQP